MLREPNRCPDCGQVVAETLLCPHCRALLGSPSALTQSGFEGANLDGARLGGTDVRGAQLPRASLRDADLTWADLSGANLEFADLTGANLADATVDGANLHRAKVDVRHAQTLSGYTGTPDWVMTSAVPSSEARRFVAGGRSLACPTCGGELFFEGRVSLRLEGGMPGTPSEKTTSLTCARCTRIELFARAPSAR